MKQFIVFAFYHYYPTGGMDDFHSSFDTEDEAIARVKELQLEKHYDEFQIFDTVTRKITTFNTKER